VHCPACDRTLLRLKTGSVTLDVCHGCGGIWFDHRELEKVNAEHPEAGDSVVEFDHDSSTHVNESRTRPCPRCKTVILEQKLYSLGSGVIMDTCPKCNGLWLDHGELENIRESLHPLPRQRRHADVRKTPAQKIAIDFEVIQQVQILRHGPQPRA
jgi:Zn-finger nucleic acid-binding protein